MSELKRGDRAPQRFLRIFKIKMKNKKRDYLKKKLWKKLLKKKIVRAYVENAYNIFMGNPDDNLIEKARSLDSVVELYELKKISPKDLTWHDFTGAVCVENQVQKGLPETLDRNSFYHTLKAWRYEILINMFKKYGLINMEREREKRRNEKIF